MRILLAGVMSFGALSLTHCVDKKSTTELERETLSAKIAEAKSFMTMVNENQDLYDEGSVDRLEEEIREAEVLETSPVSQEELDQAIKDLEQAMGDVSDSRKVVDVTPLEEMIQTAREFLAGLPPETDSDLIYDLDYRLQIASDNLAEGQLTQRTVNRWVEEIRSDIEKISEALNIEPPPAIRNPQPPVTGGGEGNPSVQIVAALHSLLEGMRVEASAWESGEYPGQYPKEPYDAFYEALSRAYSLLEDGQATKEELEAAYREANEAKLELQGQMIPYPDVEPLQERIEKAMAILGRAEFKDSDKSLMGPLKDMENELKNERLSERRVEERSEQLSQVAKIRGRLVTNEMRCLDFSGGSYDSYKEDDRFRAAQLVGCHHGDSQVFEINEDGQIRSLLYENLCLEAGSDYKLFFNFCEREPVPQTQQFFHADDGKLKSRMHSTLMVRGMRESGASPWHRYLAVSPEPKKDDHDREMSFAWQPSYLREDPVNYTEQWEDLRENFLPFKNTFEHFLVWDGEERNPDNTIAQLLKSSEEMLNFPDRFAEDMTVMTDLIKRLRVHGRLQTRTKEFVDLRKNKLEENNVIQRYKENGTDAQLWNLNSKGQLYHATAIDQGMEGTMCAKAGVKEWVSVRDPAVGGRRPQRRKLEDRPYVGIGSCDEKDDKRKIRFTSEGYIQFHSGEYWTKTQENKGTWINVETSVNSNEEWASSFGWRRTEFWLNVRLEEIPLPIKPE